jgi:hypothetical protein
MESVYHIVTIRVNETSWAHVWRLCSRYLGTGYDISDHLKPCGIITQLTLPGTPEWNGVFEQRNRTLLDMVRLMMSQTNLLMSFWGYALETAVFILREFQLSLLRGHYMRYGLGSTPDCLSAKFGDVRLMSNV